MKTLGILLILSGSIWGIIAFNMPTTVNNETSFSSTNSYSFPKKVNNFGLMHRRQNNILGAGVIFLSGIILFGFGGLSKDSYSSLIKKCLFCEEFVKIDAVTCKYCNSTISQEKIVYEDKILSDNKDNDAFLIKKSLNSSTPIQLSNATYAAYGHVFNDAQKAKEYIDRCN